MRTTKSRYSSGFSCAFLSVSLSTTFIWTSNPPRFKYVLIIDFIVFKEFLPKDYKREDVITYQWQQNRDTSLKGHFNFYFNVSKNSISRGSMFLYLVLLTVIGVVGNLIADLIGKLLGL